MRSSVFVVRCLRIYSKFFMTDNLRDDSESASGKLPDEPCPFRVNSQILRPEGPEVDPFLLMRYVDKALLPDEMLVVEQLVSEWSEWFWTFLQLESWRREAVNMDQIAVTAGDEIVITRSDLASCLLLHFIPSRDGLSRGQEDE